MSKRTDVLSSAIASQPETVARHHGVIRYIEKLRNFGVINYKGDRTWVHISELEKAGLRDAEPGTPVSFKLIFERHGKSQAVDLARG